MADFFCALSGILFFTLFLTAVSVVGVLGVWKACELFQEWSRKRREKSHVCSPKETDY